MKRPLFALCLAWVFEEAVQAATRTWDGGDLLNTNWTDATNWDSNIAPVAGDTLFFPVITNSADKATVNDFAAGTDFAKIGIGAAGYTFDGASLDLTTTQASGYSIDVQFSSGTSAFTKGTIGLFGGDHAFRIGLAGTKPTLETQAINLNTNRLAAVVEGSLVVNGVISNSSASSAVTKDGAGSMFLEASNTYTGTTQVLDGALVVNGSTSTGTVSVAASSSLNGSGTIGGAVTCSGTLSPGYSTTTGILTLNSNLSMIAGSGAIASFRITGTSPGTNHDQLGAAGNVSLNSANLSLSFGSYTPVAGSVFTLLDKTSAGAISGTFSGIPEGHVKLVEGNVLRFSYTGGDGNDFTATVGAIRTWDGGGADNKWSTAANWVGDVAPLGGDTLVFPSGAPADSLSMTNDFPNDTAFAKIQFTGGGYTATPAVAGSNRVRLLEGFEDNHSGAANTWSILLQCAADLTVSVTGSASLTLGAAIDTNDCQLTLHCDNAGATPILTVSSTISGLGAVLKTGADAVRFSGTASNTYAGGTIVQQGELQLQKSSGVNAVPSPNSGNPPLTIGNGTLAATVSSTTSNQIFDSVIATIHSGSTLSMGGTETIGGLVLAPTASVASGSNLLTVGGDVTCNGAGTSTISGRITVTGVSNWTVNSGHVLQLDAALTGNIPVAGTGRLVLAGTNGAGFVSMEEGTLEVPGDSHLLDVYLTAANLLGTGSVKSIKLNPAAAAVVAPGNGIGTLTCTGATALALNGQATVRFEIGGTTAGSGHDQLLISGSDPDLDNITNGAAKLDITFTGGFLPAVGNQFVIINKTSVGTISGIFQGLLEGQRFMVGPALMQISYQGGTDNNDVVLTCIDLPAVPLRVWDGGAGDGNWATAANWVGDILPTTGEDLEFPIPSGGVLATVNNLPSDTSFRTITISHGLVSPAVTFSGNPIVLTGGIDCAALATGIGTVAWGIPVTLGTDIVLVNSGGTPFDFNANLALAGHNLIFRSGSSTTNFFNYGGSISGSGTLVKDGNGTVRFDGGSTNTYSGSATVSAGTLALARSGVTCITGSITIGDGTNTAVLSSNGEMSDATTVAVQPNGSWSAGTDTIAAVTLAGGTLTPTNLTVSGNLTVTASGATNLGGILTLGGSAGTTHQVEVPAGATLTLTTVNQSATGMKLRKTGSGTLELNGVVTIGEALLTGGTLKATSNSPTLPVKLDAPGAILCGHGGVGPVTSVTGGTLSPGTSAGDLATGGLSLNAAATVTLEINGPTPVTQYDQLVVTGTVSLGNASLSWSFGAGYAPLPGQEFVLVANDGSDAITGIFAGIPEGFQQTDAAGTTVTFTYHGGDGNDFAIQALVGTRTWDGGGANNRWTTAANWVGDVAPVAGDMLVFPPGAPADSLSMSNDYANNTAFDSIQFTGAGYTVNPQVAESNRVRLQRSIDDNHSGTGNIFNVPLRLEVPVTISATGSGNLTIGGEVDLNGFRLTLHCDNPSATPILTAWNSIIGAGGLLKTGSDRVRLAGSSSNWYSGGTTVQQGELRLSKSSGATAIPYYQGDPPLMIGGVLAASVTTEWAEQIHDSAVVEVASGSTFAPGAPAADETIGDLHLAAGSIVTMIDAATLTVAKLTATGAGSSTISGKIATTLAGIWNVADGHTLQINGPQSGSFEKKGNGRIVMAGTNGSGFCILTGGTLEVTGDCRLTTVALGGGTLSGTGTVATVGVSGYTPGGILAPGLGIGRLTCAGDTALDLENAITLAIEIAGTTAGTGYDQVRVTGTSAYLDNASLQVSFSGGFVPAVGNQFVVIDKTTTGSVTGTFAGLREGQRFSVGPALMQISYSGGTGNDTVLTCIALPAQPLSVWDGGGGDSNWATPANWLGDVLPPSGSDLEFPVPLSGNLATNNNLPPDTAFHDISIWAGQGSPVVSFSGNRITLTGGITSTATLVGTVVWNIPLTLGADALFRNNGGTLLDMNADLELDGHTATFRCGSNTNNYFTWSGAISGNGSIVKDDPGTVRFDGSAPNTYAGTVTVHEGTLLLARSGATCLTGEVTVSDGSHAANLTSNGELASSCVVTIGPAGLWSPGTDTVASLTFAGGSTTGGTLTVTGDLAATTGTSHLNGRLVLDGSAGAIHRVDIASGASLSFLQVDQAAVNMQLRKTGAGKLVLSGIANVWQAVLVAGSIEAQSNSPDLGVLLDAPGTLLTGNGSVGTVTGGGGGTVAPGDDVRELTATGLQLNAATTLGLEINGPSPGTQHDQIKVTDAMELGGATLSYTLGAGFLPLPGHEYVLIANDGGYPIGGTFAGIPQGFILTVVGGLKFRCSYQGGDGNDFSLTVLPVEATGVTRVWDGGSTTDNNWTSAANWVGDQAPEPGDSLAFPGTASRKSPDNDFPAGMTFAALEISGDGGTPYTISGNRLTLMDRLAYLRTGTMTQFQIPLTLTNELTVQVSGDSALVFTGAIDLAGHTLYLDNNFVPSESTLDMLRFVGVISGAGGIQLDGVGTTDFAVTNTYSGDTICRGGKIWGNIPGNLTLGGGIGTATASSFSTQLPDTATLTVLVNGRYDVSTRSDTISQLILQGGTVKFNFDAELWIHGDVTVSGTTPSNFTYDNNGGYLGLVGTAGSVHALHVETGSLVTFAYGARVRSVAAGTTLNKTGGGKVVFKGNNTVAGITCSEGDTAFQTYDGSSSTNVPVTLAGGTLLGDTAVGTLTAATAGGTIKPGLSPGRLSSKDLTLSSTTTLVIELLHSTPVTGHDQLKVTGAVDLGGATLTLTELSGYVPPVGKSLVLIDNDGTEPITGTFAGLPEGSSVTLGQTSYRCSYVGGTGNDFTVTPSVAPSGITRVWSGNGTNNLWRNPDNWTGGVAPALGDSIEFPEGAFRTSNSNDYQAGFVFHQLSITGTTYYSLGGASLALTGGIAASSPSTIIHTINLIPVLGANQTFSNNAFAGAYLSNGLDLNGFTLTLSSDNPAGGVDVFNALTGTGHVVIDGSGKSRFYYTYSWSGTTTVKRGTLELGNNSTASVRGPLSVGGFGSPASVIVANSGNILSTSDVSVGALGSITLNSGISAGIRHLSIQAGTITGGGNLSVNGDLVMQGGSIGGSGSLSCRALVAARGSTNSLIQRPLTASDPAGNEHPLEVEAASRLDLDGTVASDPNGTYFRKTGAGTVVFNANSNSLQRLVVTAGAARFTGTSPAVAIFLDGGRLEGDGGTGNMTSNAGGGTVAPGTSTGDLSTRNLAWNSATVFAVEIGGTTPASGHDQLLVTGTVTLGGATLDLSLIDAFVPASGTAFVILQNDGTDPVTGTFAGLTEGASVSAGGFPFHITYQGGDGNDVALVAAEPPGPPRLADTTITPAGAGGGSADAVFSGTVTGGTPGATARLEATSTLLAGDWTVIATMPCNGSGEAVFSNVVDPGTGTDPLARIRRFYRVAIIAP